MEFFTITTSKDPVKVLDELILSKRTGVTNEKTGKNEAVPQVLQGTTCIGVYDGSDFCLNLSCCFCGAFRSESRSNKTISASEKSNAIARVVDCYWS
jgi:hypothetical protein